MESPEAKPALLTPEYLFETVQSYRNQARQKRMDADACDGAATAIEHLLKLSFPDWEPVKLQLVIDESQQSEETAVPAEIVPDGAPE